MLGSGKFSGRSWHLHWARKDEENFSRHWRLGDEEIFPRWRSQLTWNGDNWKKARLVCGTARNPVCWKDSVCEREW